MVNLEGQRRTIAKAEKFVIDREVKHLQKLVDMGNNQGPEGAVNKELDSEVARLKPDGKWDQEEVKFATDVYTSGRKDRQKPRLSQIKSEKWAKDGS